jgi:cytochrome P450
VKETLRLYPTSWVIAREAVETCCVGPFRVDPGTVMVMSQWVIHRDERFFDAADRFQPERWLDAPQRLPRFAYFPFGGGPRICIGNAFAGMAGPRFMTSNTTVSALPRASSVIGCPLPPCWTAS